MEGSTVRVWSDASGRITGPPATSGEIRLHAAGWATAAGGAVILSCGLLHTTVARLLDRHRVHEGDRQWAAVAPRRPLR